MGKRWELMVTRKIGEGRFINTRVGMIFENDKGNLNIKLDQGLALVASEGAQINGFIPRERPPMGASRSSPQQPLPSSSGEEW